jgi:hypothetical protein
MGAQTRIAQAFHRCMWRRHFEANRSRPLPVIEAPPVSDRQRALLISSLARFQLGETGEGRIAQQIRRVRLPGVDDDYCACIAMFVAEEGRHARILALMVKALGGRLLERSWTHGLFSFARHLVGVRFKLLVLLAAEVIAIGFYGLLAKWMPAFHEICADEDAHLRFHCDFLRQQSPWLRAVWWPLGTAAALTVLFDHRATLRAFGVPLPAAAGVLLSQVSRAAGLMRRAPGAGAARRRNAAASGCKSCPT